MTNDIRTFVESCKACFRNLLSLPANKISTDPPSASYGPPMAHVGVDLFEFSGKQYLICVDKWSGCPVYTQLNTVTTRAVIGVLEDWFNILGWPSTIRSDGGPQFLGPFKAWCQDNNIIHELSSPYNPRGNGLAEAAVKNVKHLLQKCSISRESANKALYFWRNVPRSDGYSPAQLLFGRRQLTNLPMLQKQYEQCDFSSAKEAKDSKKKLKC